MLTRWPILHSWGHQPPFSHPLCRVKCGLHTTVLPALCIPKVGTPKRPGPSPPQRVSPVDNGPGQRGADESSMRRDDELLIQCQEHPSGGGGGRWRAVGDWLHLRRTSSPTVDVPGTEVSPLYFTGENSSDACDEHHGDDSSSKPCPKQAVRLRTQANYVPSTTQYIHTQVVSSASLAALG